MHMCVEEGACSYKLRANGVVHVCTARYTSAKSIISVTGGSYECQRTVCTARMHRLARLSSGELSLSLFTVRSVNSRRCRPV